MRTLIVLSSTFTQKDEPKEKEYFLFSYEKEFTGIIRKCAVQLVKLNLKIKFKHIITNKSAFERKKINSINSILFNKIDN